jgi:flavorubredoxin
MDDHYIYDVRKGLKGLREKPYLLFYSHGGGGRVKDSMQRVFSRVGTLIGEPIGSKGRPDQQVIEKCKALAKELIETVS